MFSKSAAYYDVIYSFKDYQAEAETLAAVIRENLRSGGNRLLDVACGTGQHITYLKKHFAVEGLDISEELLTVARQRNPLVPFHHGDMIDFDLGRRFDVVTCLFSSIGYVRTIENLTQAVCCMARHLVPGGVTLIEPWFTPDTWRAGTVHAQFIDEPKLKIARVNTSFTRGRMSSRSSAAAGRPSGQDRSRGLAVRADRLARRTAMSLGSIPYDSEWRQYEHWQCGAASFTCRNCARTVRSR